MEVLGEINNFCRFCLSQDCENLIPLSSAIESLSFSLQDIQETTGISILESETECLAVCTTCSNSIDLAVDFRRSCLNGNVLFLQLFGHIIDKLRSSDIAEGNLEDAVDAKQEPLKIEIILQNEITDETSYKTHDEAILPMEESIELFDENDWWKDENSSSEDLPDIHTNIFPSKEKATNSKISSAASRRKAKSNGRVEESLEDIAKQPKKRKKVGKQRKQLCGICGALVARLNDHTRSHTKENLLKCPHCPVQFANSGNLFRHVHTLHKKTIIKSCGICGKGFKNYNGYKKHMLTQHNIGKQYQCEICLKTFNTTTSRLQHIRRIHIAEWKYECQICQRKFKDPNALRRHGKVHSDDTPYACSNCPKRFKSQSAKKIHENTHSGIEFPCTLCTKAYRYKSQLSNHYRKCHPVESSGE